MAKCTNPILLKNRKNMEGQMVPCGHCENCRKTRVSNWSFRLMQERKWSDTAYFITLTYGSDIPITPNGFMDLRKRDIQLFFKRLRKLHDQSGNSLPLKYYAVGEYGGRANRPHFHVILFNACLTTLIGKKYADAVRAKTIVLDGKRPFSCPAWGFNQIMVYGVKAFRVPCRNDIGHITIGEVNEASVGYTCKYMLKPSRIPMHRNDDRTPEFSLMSKGLGIDYLTPAMKMWHYSDMVNRQYCQTLDGKKVSLPRYYKEKLLDEHEREELRLINVARMMEKPVKKKLSAKQKGEAHFAGIRRLHNNVSQNQKF